jgi:hypothetical protein
MDWARILAYVTGTVDQELLARIEYLAAENRILKVQLKGRLKLSDAERATLAEIGPSIGPQGSRRGCDCGPARHNPGLVPQAGRPQIRWLQGASKPGPAADQARGRAADRSHGKGEP